MSKEDQKDILIIQLIILGSLFAPYASDQETLSARLTNIKQWIKESSCAILITQIISTSKMELKMNTKMIIFAQNMLQNPVRWNEYILVVQPHYVQAYSGSIPNKISISTSITPL